MGKWNKIGNWNDDWLKANYLNYPSYTALAEEYNRVFGTSYAIVTIKSRCHRELGLRKPHAESNLRFTEEQKAWIRENYPILGETETTKQFNEKFHMNKPVHSIVKHCCRQGIKVNKDVANRNHGKFYDPNRKRDVGDVKIFKGRHVIKTEDGQWVSRQRYIYEKETGKKIPPKHHVIFLDGNPENFDINNLMCVPMKYNGILSGYGLRSEDPELTKTGVMWCELYDALGINKDQLYRAERTLFDCDLGLEG